MDTLNTILTPQHIVGLAVFLAIVYLLGRATQAPASGSSAEAVKEPESGAD